MIKEHGGAAADASGGAAPEVRFFDAGRADAVPPATAGGALTLRSDGTALAVRQ